MSNPPFDLFAWEGEWRLSINRLSSTLDEAELSRLWEVLKSARDLLFSNARKQQKNCNVRHILL